MRRISSILAALTLAACGGSSETPTDPPADAPADAATDPATPAEAEPPKADVKPGPVLSRKNILDSTPAEILFFRLGVQQMRLDPLSSPSNWNWQANVHGYPKMHQDPLEDSTAPFAGHKTCTQADVDRDACEARALNVPSTEVCNIMYTGDVADMYTDKLPAEWNNCMHGSHYFTSWHRLHLYHFEQILRDAGFRAMESLKAAHAGFEKGTPDGWEAADKDKVAAAVKMLGDAEGSLRDSFGLPYWDYSDEGGLDGTTWAADDTILPVAMKEGTACTGMNNPGTADERLKSTSSLRDVVLGSCNPLKIPDTHRSPWCNGEGKCMFKPSYDDANPDTADNAPSGPPSGLGDDVNYYDAKPALAKTCSYVCTTEEASNNPLCCAVADDAADEDFIVSFHGDGRLADLTGIPTAHHVHNGAKQGALENTPHSFPHNRLGNMLNPYEAATFNMGFMTLNACAGRDPGFYVHHSNIDRLWQVWVSQGENFQDPADGSADSGQGWMGQSFPFQLPNGAGDGGRTSTIDKPCNVYDTRSINPGGEAGFAAGYRFIKRDGTAWEPAAHTRTNCAL